MTINNFKERKSVLSQLHSSSHFNLSCKDWVKGWSLLGQCELVFANHDKKILTFMKRGNHCQSWQSDIFLHIKKPIQQMSFLYCLERKNESVCTDAWLLLVSSLSQTHMENSTEFMHLNFTRVMSEERCKHWYFLTFKYLCFQHIFINM